MNNTRVPGDTVIVEGLAPFTDKVMVGVIVEPPLLPPPDGPDGDDPHPDGRAAASAMIAVNACF